eukprot:TRINITY_DN1999_c0_g1_i1.p1 TRINITY_DN1999_c0_g1~~TRINITY_DN1999_c0_g1_i1.p1  ORF type:complete len:170 (+),score=0.16 TRINITY_DN1999_c0_g1_i1:85-594(+)
MEKCYCDWGEHGGDWCMCLQFFSGNMECCEPCCGQPCNSSDGVYCCLSWFPCCCLAAPKCYAASQNQECAVINHCVPFLGLLLSIIPIIGGILSFAVYCAIRTAIRFNLRKQHGIGQDECDLCDCCGIWFYVPALASRARSSALSPRRAGIGMLPCRPRSSLPRPRSSP